MDRWSIWDWVKIHGQAAGERRFGSGSVLAKLVGCSGKVADRSQSAAQSDAGERQAPGLGAVWLTVVFVLQGAVIGAGLQFGYSALCGGEVRKG